MGLLLLATGFGQFLWAWTQGAGSAAAALWMNLKHLTGPAFLAGLAAGPATCAGLAAGPVA